MTWGKTEDVGVLVSQQSLSGLATTHERIVITAKAHASIIGCVSRQPYCFVHVF